MSNIQSTINWQCQMDFISVVKSLTLQEQDDLLSTNCRSRVRNKVLIKICEALLITNAHEILAVKAYNVDLYTEFERNVVDLVGISNMQYVCCMYTFQTHMENHHDFISEWVPSLGCKELFSILCHANGARICLCNISNMDEFQHIDEFESSQQGPLRHENRIIVPSIASTQPLEPYGSRGLSRRTFHEDEFAESISFLELQSYTLALSVSTSHTSQESAALLEADSILQHSILQLNDMAHPRANRATIAETITERIQGGMIDQIVCFLVKNYVIGIVIIVACIIAYQDYM